MNRIVMTSSPPQRQTVTTPLGNRIKCHIKVVTYNVRSVRIQKNQRLHVMQATTMRACGGLLYLRTRSARRVMMLSQTKLNHEWLKKRNNRKTTRRSASRGEAFRLD